MSAPQDLALPRNLCHWILYGGESLTCGGYFGRNGGDLGKRTGCLGRLAGGCLGRLASGCLGGLGWCLGRLAGWCLGRKLGFLGVRCLGLLGQFGYLARLHGGCLGGTRYLCAVLGKGSGAKKGKEEEESLESVHFILIL
eukprot:scaffold5490_cov125-Cylindrotheca_fusiformis.AAC.16